MASKPYPEKRGDKLTGQWVMKWRPDPEGKWVRVVLGNDPRLLGARPPKVPPQEILDKHREFSEREYGAKHGLALAANRPKALAGYLESYMAAFESSHKPGSVRQLRRHVRDFSGFLSRRGINSVQAVNRSACRDFMAFKIALVSKDTLRTIKGYLSPIWSQALEDELVAANPWANLKIPGKSTKGEGTVWTSAEVGRIAALCCKAWQTEFVVFLANTGLRISTGLMMRWDWRDPSVGEYGAIRIPKDEAAERDGIKTSYVHLLSAAAHDLLNRREVVVKSDLVFPNPYGGGEVPYDSARNAIQDAIKKAGVKYGTPHSLRRTYATLLYRKTKDLDLVRRQLGHTSIATTQKYLGVYDDGDAQGLSGFSVGDVN